MKRSFLLEIAIIAAVLVGAIGALENSAMLAWLDRALLDTQLTFMRSAPPEDVVIVGIDDSSLETLGRWPWSRRLHARLLDRLGEAGAKVVGLDINFAEPDRSDPAADAILARAIARNGRVVLPVLPQQNFVGGQLFEQLSIEPLPSRAAGLGHVDVELQVDGLARDIFLRAGLGDPHWPAFALTMVELGENRTITDLPGERRHAPVNKSSRVWVRDYRAIVPFAGAPGHFSHVSYALALSGDVPAEAFAGKFVLVGMTASGLADIVPTAASGQSEPMAGVEFIANVVHALRTERLIEPIGRRAALFLTTLLALLPLVLYPRLRPGADLVAVVAVAVTIIALSSCLLVFARLWFPPATALACALASYPIWTWRRLDAALRYLDQELAALRLERTFPVTAPATAPSDPGKALARKRPIAVARRPHFDLLQERIFNVQRLAAEVRRQQRAVRLGLRHMVDGLLLVDRDGQTLLANHQAARFLGIAEEQDLAGLSTLDLLQRLEATTITAWDEDLAQAINEGSSEQRGATGSDGTELRIQFAAVHDAASGETSAVVSLADVSSLREAERRRAELASFLSHDLRSPLISVMALGELAQEDIDAEELRTMLERASSHTSNALQMVDQFLSLLRAESETGFRAGSCDLVSIALDAVDDVWDQARSRGATLTHDFDIEEAWCEGDSDLLRRMLSNLLTNAVKYGRDGVQIAMRVALHDDAQDRFYRLTVEDDGPGISAEDVGKMFERFERLGASRSGVGGLGLGLSFVKTVVERHAGKLEVDSELGRGTAFHILVPLSMPRPE